MSGFGPNHREKSDEDETERNDSDMRESCTTTGFDFYINNNNLGTMQNVMINRERNLFSPPFKTRAEMADVKQ